MRLSRSFQDNQSGSASVLVAVSVVPILLTIGLLIDIGGAWINRDRAQQGVQAAAAIAALHKDPACLSGPLSEVDQTTNAEAIAAYRLSSGREASELVITCTDDGVDVIGRQHHEVSVLSLLGLEHAAIGAKASASSPDDRRITWTATAAQPSNE